MHPTPHILLLFIILSPFPDFSVCHPTTTAADLKRTRHRTLPVFAGVNLTRMCGPVCSIRVGPSASPDNACKDNGPAGTR